ncbi:hypothetical protein [Rubellicoccus peritrichatus]|uniref:Lipoprotein n=1 Tax=Rubellicoccus peritrichatus TaxID=3080537 RepID=A0AAQ3LA04_9BACT|nr:hypothetical protein [Puniceicoccus sp. CR14]WOO42389.1 hypothetical protein RZN69_04755 [Puniceicoccus sp. CR14]
MSKFIAFAFIVAAFTGCKSLDNDVISGKDSGKGDAGQLAGQNQRETETVNEFYNQGQLTSFEKQQMDESIGGSQNPAGENGVAE